MPLIRNFGRNVEFTAAERYAPRGDDEVLDILRRHKRIRCVGAGHSWSRILEIDGVVLDMRHFDSVEVADMGVGAMRTGARVRLGAGCTIKRALAELARHGLTLPTLGAITGQTIAGALSTGTHGSGAPSLSHFVEEVRLAGFDPESGEPSILRFRGRDELLAARCALGCMGVILDVVIRAAPACRVKERFEEATLEDIEEGAATWPLQQFVLFPWAWRYMVYRRQMTDERETWIHAAVMRAQLFLWIDVLQHGFLRWALLPAARVLGSWLIRFFYRRLILLSVPEHRRVDDSHRVLTLRHDLFRHVEMEVFVPERELRPAVASIRALIEQRASVSQDAWTHHYPISFRYVQRDDTLVSMSSADDAGTQTWVAISFFTYRPVDAAFHGFATAMAQCLVEAHRGRLHWGKYFPMDFRKAAARYPDFDRFEEICRRYDPARTFWSENL